MKKWCGVLVLFFLLGHAPLLHAAGPPSKTDRAIQAHLQALETAQSPEKIAASQKKLVSLGTSALPSLHRALLDAKTPWPQRASAAWVLGEIGDASSLTPLKKLFKQKKAPENARIQAAIALGSLKNTKPLLQLLKSSKNDIIVAKAATSLANFREREAIPFLHPHLKNEQIGVFVAMALARLGDDSGKEQIAPLLKDPFMRDYAAVALGKLGDRSVLLPIRFALQNPDPFLRRDAVLLMDRFDDVGGRADLIKLQKQEKDKRVKKPLDRVVKRFLRLRKRY